MDQEAQNLTPFAKAVVEVFDEKNPVNHEPKILVNRFVSELASWYEKLRNAMDLQEEAVILKNAIERILKRRLLLGGTGERIAEPLLRELVWARYFPDNSLPQSFVVKTAEIINLYLDLKHLVLEHHKISEQQLNDWMFQLMSCEISILLNPQRPKDVMSNFMYHTLKNHVTITDDTEDTKNVQIYLAVRRAYARDDLPFLRFYLFKQLFPTFSKENVEEVAKAFLKGKQEIERQLKYRLKEKIYVYVKRQTPVFFILDDVLKTHKNNINTLIHDLDKFGNEVMSACNAKYKNIGGKVRTAIIRSVFFILLTKVLFAFAIEGSYDKFTIGHIVWKSLIVNIVAPPLLMVIVSFFIKTPGADNSRRIFGKIKQVLFEENPRLSPYLSLTYARRAPTLIGTVFTLLWLGFFILSFGLMVNILSNLHLNIVSQGIFIFFITIVSFLSYRINLTAHAYTVDQGQGLLTPFIDILFLPIIKVGMRLTDGISQLNIIIFVFDFIIEAPFKTIFGFFEQLFVYLHAKRDDLE
jgi:hypothetical protein